MRQFFPKSRMGIFTLILVVFWGLKSLFAGSILRTSPGIAFLLDITLLLLAIPAIYYCIKLFKGLRNRLLWKIRRRLIIAHIFIGAIPVFLVLCIFWFSALLVYYQLSYYLVSNQIGIHVAQIHAFNLSLREGLQGLMTGTESLSPAALKEQLDADAKYLLGAYPSASIILSFPDAARDRMTTYFNQSSNPEGNSDYRIPHWLTEREFSGLVIDDRQQHPKKPRLFIRSFVYSDIRPDLQFNLEVSIPFDHYFLGRLKAAIGQDLLLADGVERSGLMLQGADLVRENTIETTYESERSRSATDTLWAISLFPILWTTGMETHSTSSNVLLVELSTAKLMGNLFRSENNVGTKILGVLETIVVFFLLVEIASVVIGILLTKSITNAVHNLDRGTEFVKRGDFSHRIIVRSDDQLGALAASFNQMTEYVQDLVKERVQKERLERELEIAKEVQERLFPDDAPKMARMDLAGVCLPARTVSGDYYDFLPLGMHELGLALGDICGKGISAALLMANLQATLRSNVMNLWGQHGDLEGDRTVAELIERVNSQIYSYTSANKFATFFYALYNEVHQTLTYCNAGHNPPLYFSNGSVRRLMSGGTVVGIFADSRYEQETIHLHEEDLLIAYTDGIVESVNEYGEEFGEHRLIQLVQQHRHSSATSIKDIIVERVLSWTFSEERDDDMTLIIARIMKASEITDNSKSNT